MSTPRLVDKRSCGVDYSGRLDDEEEVAINRSNTPGYYRGIGHFAEPDYAQVWLGRRNGCTVEEGCEGERYCSTTCAAYLGTRSCRSAPKLNHESE